MPVEPIYFADAATLKYYWFSKHAAEAIELVIGFMKTSSGMPGITWPQAVDEDLCVGWIDGLRHRIDDQRYKIRFAPRKIRSNWSVVNIRRLAQLQAEGHMLPARVNIPVPSPEALQKSNSVVRGAYASRVSVWASRPNHPDRPRRAAEGSRRDACAPRANAIQAEASFGLLDPEGIMAFKKRTEARSGTASYEQTKMPELDAEEIKLFKQQPVAWAYFELLPPGYRKKVLGLVVKPSARQKRLLHSSMPALWANGFNRVQRERGIKINAFHHPVMD